MVPVLLGLGGLGLLAALFSGKKGYEKDLDKFNPDSPENIKRAQTALKQVAPAIQSGDPQKAVASALASKDPGAVLAVQEFLVQSGAAQAAAELTDTFKQVQLEDAQARELVPKLVAVKEAALAAPKQSAPVPKPAAPVLAPAPAPKPASRKLGEVAGTLGWSLNNKGKEASRNLIREFNTLAGISKSQYYGFKTVERLLKSFGMLGPMPDDVWLKDVARYDALITLAKNKGVNQSIVSKHREALKRRFNSLLRTEAKKLVSHLHSTTKGKEDKALVKKYQTYSGLKVDGLYGINTAESLFNNFRLLGPAPFYLSSNFMGDKKRYEALVSANKAVR